MDSVEGAYIGLARHIRDHFPDLSWFPLWYGGIPYQYSYPPLLHVLVAGTAAVGHISPARAYHIVVAIFYALGPVALFWTARRLGASRDASFLAGLLYSFISPSCLLIRQIRAETGDWLGPRRAVLLLRYGDGPQIAALVLATLAIGTLHVALERKRPVYYFAAAVSMAAVILTNWIGTMALAVAVGCYLLSGFGAARSRGLSIVGIGCLAYALAMPWTTPATVKAIAANAPLLVAFASSGSQRLALAGSAIAILGFAWIMMRLRVRPPLRFATMFAIAVAAITLGHFWARIDLLPQPHRYHLEMDLAVWLIIGFLLDPAFKILARLSRRPWRKALVWAAVAACVPMVIDQRRITRRMERPFEVRATPEYKISRWLSANRPGARVFAPGSFDAGMNAFGDTPMLTGGFANGIRNSVLWGANYQIYAGDTQRVGLDWLNALGCDAIVSADTSIPEFHDYSHPEKWRGLRELWRDGPAVVYEVPRLNRSLAHAVRLADLPEETPPSYYLKPIAAYLAALDDPALPRAEFQWRGSSAASIAANLRPEHLLSIHVSWDEGWKARVNGQLRRVWGDKLGQMVVEPRCNGACMVELAYDGGTQVRFARILSILTLAALLLWIFLMRVKCDNSARNVTKMHR